MRRAKGKTTTRKKVLLPNGRAAWDDADDSLLVSSVFLLQRMLSGFEFVGSWHNDRGGSRFSKSFTASNSWSHLRTIDACIFWEPDFTAQIQPISEFLVCYFLAYRECTSHVDVVQVNRNRRLRTMGILS